MSTLENASNAFRLASVTGQGRVGWRKADNVGDIFLVKDAVLANSRVGACWMRGRVKAGDLVLCVDHTGDAFHSYVLLENKGSQLHAVMGSAFGAYGLVGSARLASLEEQDFVELVSSANTELHIDQSVSSVEAAVRGVRLRALALNLNLTPW